MQSHIKILKHSYKIKLIYKAIVVFTMIVSLIGCKGNIEPDNGEYFYDENHKNNSKNVNISTHNTNSISKSIDSLLLKNKNVIQINDITFNSQHGIVLISWKKDKKARHYKISIKLKGEIDYKTLKNKVTINNYVLDYLGVIPLFNLIDTEIKIQKCNVFCEDYLSAKLSKDILNINSVQKIDFSNQSLYKQIYSINVDFTKDGKTMIVGKNGVLNSLESKYKTHEIGLVYVFSKHNGVWFEQQINAHYENDKINYGKSVAISGNGEIIAIGNPSDSTNSSGINNPGHKNDKPYSGKVEIFKNNGQTWVLVAEIKASNSDAFDNFGHRVAFSENGKTLAVSAPAESSNSRMIDGNQLNNDYQFAGSVYIFVQQDGFWIQQEYIKAMHTNIAQRYGFEIALSSDGNTLAVSAPGDQNKNTGINSEYNDDLLEAGAVYVYKRENDIWKHQAYIKPSKVSNFDLFGQSLAISEDGNTLAVGVPEEDSAIIGINDGIKNNNNKNSGAVYIFTQKNNLWSEQEYIKSNTEDLQDREQSFFGYHISFANNGNTLAISSKESINVKDLRNPSKLKKLIKSGKVHIYKRKNNVVWEEFTQITAPNPISHLEFGYYSKLNKKTGNLFVANTYTAKKNYKNLIYYY